jgi:hypothetical protein
MTKLSSLMPRPARRLTPAWAVTGCGLILSGALLTACEGVTVEEPEPYVTEQTEKIRQQSGTFHGNPKGIVIYSDREGEESLLGPDRGDGGITQPAAATAGTPVTGSAVNPFIWQAALESLEFMPLAQTDSQGGVIITDWYAPPEAPEERFKINVYVVDPTLRVDAVRVSVFRQTEGRNGWVDAAVDPATASGLEDNILARARELRLAAVGEEQG